MRKASEAARELIKKYEGLRLKAYYCPSGVLTIGYGHTGDVKRGDEITEHQADVIFDLDLEKYEAAVEKMVPASVTDGQFGALVSFAYNCGPAALEKSRLLKKLLAGDTKGAAGEFGKWVYGRNGKLPGLILRRESERQLFVSEASSSSSQ